MGMIWILPPSTTLPATTTPCGIWATASACFDGAVNVLDYVMEDYMVLANYVQAFPNGVVGASNSPPDRQVSRSRTVDYGTVNGSGRIAMEAAQREEPTEPATCSVLPQPATQPATEPAEQNASSGLSTGAIVAIVVVVVLVIGVVVVVVTKKKGHLRNDSPGSDP